MGTYTQFQATITLKPEHVRTVYELLAAAHDENRPWNPWLALLPEHPWVQPFAGLPDAHMIPFGSGQAGDPCFQELTGNVFKFACSLKNRGDVIGVFRTMILPVIAERAELSDYYPEFDCPNEWLLENGTLTQTKEATWSY